MVACVIEAGSAAFGGGIVNEGMLGFSGLISGNQASDHGGALLQLSGSVSLAKAWIDDNSALVGGGGGAYILAGSAAFIDSSVTSNVAGSGGGIFQTSSTTLELKNVTLSANEARRDGGGLFLDSGSQVTIASSTISGNIADSDGSGTGNGGGIFVVPCVGICATDKVFLRNSIVANNLDLSTSLPHAHDCDGRLTSEGYILVEDGHTSLGTCVVVGAFSGVLLGSDPQLANLSDYGGQPTAPGVQPPPTLALLPASLALNAGDPVVCTDSDGAPLPQDQRGAPRVGRCDIGAFEFNGEAPFFRDGFESGNTLAW